MHPQVGRFKDGDGEDLRFPRLWVLSTQSRYVDLRVLDKDTVAHISLPSRPRAGLFSERAVSNPFGRILQA